MWTGIPVFKLTEAETQKLMRMEDELHKRVIGQDPAIEVISKAIRRSRAGLKDPKRPTARSSSSAPPASARPSSRARSPSSCSATTKRWSGSTCPSTWRSTPSRGWSAHRPATSATTRAASSPRRPPQALQRAAARRDREGAPRRLQHPAADPRGRPADRRPGAHGRLPPRDRDHDEQHRRRRDRPQHAARLRGLPRTRRASPTTT